MFDIPKTMRAVVYRGANDLRLEVLPTPRIGSNELLVKVAACGVCPTDIKKIQHGTVPPPRVFGHETSGTVVRIGARVRGFRLGDRVALHHHVPCLHCHACAHHAFAQCAQYKRTGITAGFEPAGGGYAEYVRVMSFVLPGVVGIPDRNSFAEGAMLEPVNTVLKAVKRLAVLPRDTVLVAGQGPIGLMFTRLLSLRGLRVIVTDLIESRLQLAMRMGAWKAFQITARGAAPVGSRTDTNPAALAEIVQGLTRGKGLDAAVIAVPSDEAVREAQGLVRGAGQVLLFSHTRPGTAMNLDLSAICVQEKDMIGSYSSDFLLQSEVSKLVFSRKMNVRSLLTDTFPLSKTAQAVQLAAKPNNTSLKVLVSQEAPDPS